MPKVGDTFAFPLPSGEWLGGRILLDVAAQCIKPRKVAPMSQLAFFNKALLVEIYATPTKKPAAEPGKVLVPGAFVQPGGFRGDWQVLGNVEVDPTQVDFPAATVQMGATAGLTWGEILLPLQMPPEEVEQLGVNSSVANAAEFVGACLVELGRAGELDANLFPEPSAIAFAQSDLRLSPKGPAVFAAAGLAKRRSYHVEALERGFDVRRFYK